MNNCHCTLLACKSRLFTSAWIFAGISFHLDFFGATEASQILFMVNYHIQCTLTSSRLNFSLHTRYTMHFPSEPEVLRLLTLFLQCMWLRRWHMTNRINYSLMSLCSFSNRLDFPRLCLKFRFLPRSVWHKVWLFDILRKWLQNRK